MGAVARARRARARGAGSRASSAPTTTSRSSAARERGSLDAWTTLAALAARTERIRLGTLVSPVDVPAPVGAREERRDRRPRLGRAGRSSGSAPGGTRPSTRRTASRSRPVASAWSGFAEQLEIVASPVDGGRASTTRDASTGSRIAARCRSRCSGRGRRSSSAARRAAERSQRPCASRTSTTPSSPSRGRAGSGAGASTRPARGPAATGRSLLAHDGLRRRLGPGRGRERVRRGSSAPRTTAS